MGVRSSHVGPSLPAALWLLLVLCMVAGGREKRPNIVFLLSDDQDSWRTGGDWYMPELKRHIAEEGINFTHAVVNYALCCPARASILTGMCAHNTGVPSNVAPLGSFTRFMEQGLEDKTAHYALHQGGYRTALVGKLMNGINNFKPSMVPPGIDRWFVFREEGYYNYIMGDQKEEVLYRSETENYATDVLTEKSVEFIEDSVAAGQPFFLYLAPFAPHTPAIPAVRHAGKLAGVSYPRVPSYNESSEATGKKVALQIRRACPITDKQAAAFDVLYQRRSECLLAIDEQIDTIVQTLDNVGELDNTYFFYAGDNGFKFGNHRLQGKQSPYEEDVRVPLYVRGPGVPRGVKLPHMVANIDFLPTWLDLTGVEDPYAAQRDGKSFAPLLRNEEARSDPESFRHIMLHEKLYAGVMDTTVSPWVPVIDFEEDVYKGYRPEGGEEGQQGGRHRRGQNSGGKESDEDDEYDELQEEDYGDHEKSLDEREEEKERRGNRALLWDKIGEKYWEAKGVFKFFTSPYYALRLQSSMGTFKFIQYPEGFELYNLDEDPWELNNIYEEAPQQLLDFLKPKLDSLKTCRGDECYMGNNTFDTRSMAQKECTNHRDCKGGHTGCRQCDATRGVCVYLPRGKSCSLDTLEGGESTMGFCNGRGNCMESKVRKPQFLEQYFDVGLEKGSSVAILAAFILLVASLAALAGFRKGRSTRVHGEPTGSARAARASSTHLVASTHVKGRHSARQLSTAAHS